MRTIEECINDIKRIYPHFISGRDGNGFDKRLNEILEIHKAEKRPKGKWMNSGIGGCKVCSVCNAHMGLSNFKYCPSCGADMRESEEK